MALKEITETKAQQPDIFEDFLEYFNAFPAEPKVNQSEMCHRNVVFWWQRVLETTTMVNPLKYTQLKHILDKLWHTKLGKIKIWNIWQLKAVDEWLNHSQPRRSQVSPLFKTNDSV